MVASPDVSIEQVVRVDEQLFAACQRLVPQLTSTNPPTTLQDLELLVDSPCTALFVARQTDPAIQDGKSWIIGIATLILYRVPTGLRGTIEDVVVDQRARGHGVGEALTRRCLDFAQQAGASSVSLTSNPSRQAANHLYQKMGFLQRKTNVYKYVLTKQNIGSQKR